MGIYDPEAAEAARKARQLAAQDENSWKFLIAVVALVAIVGFWLYTANRAIHRDCPNGTEVVVILDYTGFPVGICEPKE